MERLPGLLGSEPVYWVDGVRPLPGGVVETTLGFSDVAAHPYEALVAATVAALRAVPGVEAVEHTDREVVVVRSRGVAPGALAEIVDRLWFERLPRTPVDPSFELDPAEVLVSPWPSAPPAPVGALPAPDGDPAGGVRAVVALEPSRRRMWTYLVCGALPALGGAWLALTPGGSTGVLPLALGAVNLAFGARIALRRRAART